MPRPTLAVPLWLWLPLQGSSVSEAVAWAAQPGSLPEPYGGSLAPQLQAVLDRAKQDEEEAPLAGGAGGRGGGHRGAAPAPYTAGCSGSGLLRHVREAKPHSSQPRV